MDDPGDVAEYGEHNVDEQCKPTTCLEEDTKRRENDSFRQC